jgi:probable O-glycosylation ligase (exosortase A-associated)
MFYFLARIETNRSLKWLLGITFVLSIPSILLTYSRGALVGLILVLFLMILKSRKRLLLIPVMVLTGLAAVVLLPESWKHRMDFRREGAVLDDSALSRINAWTYSWRFALDHPLTGGGFEAFTPPLFMRYAPNPNDVHGPHSIYFGVLAEHGFVGLFLYLILIVSCFVSLWRVRRSARRFGDETALTYATMLQLSLIGFLSSGAFLGFAYFDYYFCVVACTVILTQLSRIGFAEAETYSVVAEEQIA